MEGRTHTANHSQTGHEWPVSAGDDPKALHSVHLAENAPRKDQPFRQKVASAASSISFEGPKSSCLGDKHVLSLENSNVRAGESRIQGVRLLCLRGTASL